jgi:hypothetical protein
MSGCRAPFTLGDCTLSNRQAELLTD